MTWFSPRKSLVRRSKASTAMDKHVRSFTWPPRGRRKPEKNPCPEQREDVREGPPAGLRCRFYPERAAGVALHEVFLPNFIPQTGKLQKNRLHNALQTEHTLKHYAARDGPPSFGNDSLLLADVVGLGWPFMLRDAGGFLPPITSTICKSPEGVKGTIPQDSKDLDIDVTEKFSAMHY